MEPVLRRQWDVTTDEQFRECRLVSGAVREGGVRKGKRDDSVTTYGRTAIISPARPPCHGPDQLARVANQCTMQDQIY